MAVLEENNALNKIAEVLKPKKTDKVEFMSLHEFYWAYQQKTDTPDKKAVKK